MSGINKHGKMTSCFGPDSATNADSMLGDSFQPKGTPNNAMTGALSTEYTPAETNVVSNMYEQIRLGTTKITTPQTFKPIMPAIPALDAVYDGARAVYFASDFNTATNIWTDKTTNYNDITATAGVYTVITSATGNGNTITFPILKGSSACRLNFTTAQINNFTIFHISRCPSTTTGAIISGATTNVFFSGFWQNLKCGVSYMGGWVGSTSDKCGTKWVLSVNYPYSYRCNSVFIGSNGTISYLPPFGINLWPGAPASFEIAEMVIFDRTLTNAEIQTMEAYLTNKYGINYTVSAF